MAYSTVSSLGIDTIPNYLSAESPRRLRALMRRNNLRHRAYIRYFDIQYVATENKWYVWYLLDASSSMLTDQERSELDE